MIKPRFSQISATVAGIAAAVAFGVVNVSADSKTEYNVPISTIHPTQAAVGKAQIASKISTYVENGALTKDYYNDFNDDNGYTNGLYSLDGVSQTDKTLYKTNSIQSAMPDAQLTSDSAAKVPVIKGPGGVLYATDGHHGSTTYEFIKQQYNLGFDTINVEVIDDYSSLSMTDFYKTLIAKNQVLPLAFNVKTGEYQSFSLDRLPTHMYANEFVNDPFRSLAYFWRKSAIDKDNVTANFAEFYLGIFLTSTCEFKGLSFESQNDYLTAFDKGNAILQKLINGDTTYTALFNKVLTIPYGVTPSMLGIQSTFDDTKIAAQRQKLTDALTFLTNTPALATSNTTLFDLNTEQLTKQVATFKALTAADYTNDSYQKVSELIASANELVSNNGSQTDLDSLTSQIEQALGSLVKVPTTETLDTTQFEKQVSRFNNLTATKYDATNYQNIKDTIAEIQGLIKNNGTQNELNTKVESLQSKIDALTPVSSDNTSTTTSSTTNEKIKTSTSSKIDSQKHNHKQHLKLPKTMVNQPNIINRVMLGLVLFAGIGLTYKRFKLFS
ncbi:ParB/Srx family N-terminal domain-containing protein [Leuconostoc pseudomesenteroides]|uniref:ParB/Srx family N-terminal domain-containing protein n=1 Tax=Leuconostoc pseudomesenteroides TaxID=33968 RepID=UPI0014445226|nr:ParB/Srx family N-terminal domain-containing protein [Leuconostoc pseudomesenteroides]MCC8439577.1 hypothetical protein [Leuconostoc pseudomesenteroides]NKZ35938.1 hypothetical protein [Leuconostoc pseudomesenteroides]